MSHLEENFPQKFSLQFNFVSICVRPLPRFIVTTASFVVQQHGRGAIGSFYHLLTCTNQEFISTYFRLIFLKHLEIFRYHPFLRSIKENYRFIWKIQLGNQSTNPIHWSINQLFRCYVSDQFNNNSLNPSTNLSWATIYPLQATCHHIRYPSKGTASEWFFIQFLLHWVSINHIFIVY